MSDSLPGLETLKSSEPAAAAESARRSRVGSAGSPRGWRSLAIASLPAFSSLLFSLSFSLFLCFFPSFSLSVSPFLFICIRFLFFFLSLLHLKEKDRSHQMFSVSRTPGTFRSFSDFEATNRTQSPHGPRGGKFSPWVSVAGVCTFLFPSLSFPVSFSPPFWGLEPHVAIKPTHVEGLKINKRYLSRTSSPRKWDYICIYIFL